MTYPILNGQKVYMTFNRNLIFIFCENINLWNIKKYLYKLKIRQNRDKSANDPKYEYFFSQRKYQKI